jgi:hypothetical protein
MAVGGRALSPDRFGDARISSPCLTLAHEKPYRIGACRRMDTGLALERNDGNHAYTREERRLHWIGMMLAPVRDRVPKEASAVWNRAVPRDRWRTDPVPARRLSPRS